jgi:hypothetical protein
MSQAIDANRTFQKLLVDDGNVEASIALFRELQAKEELSIEDTGWILWNICDRYAMRRDAQNQFPYQSEFHTWVGTHFSPERLHWVVSDGTQARTLIDGGYLFPWWQWYLDANERAPRIEGNRNVRFESHRATADALTYFAEFEKAEFSLAALENLLQEDLEWDNYNFAEATYRTILIDFYRSTGQSRLLQNTADRLVSFLELWSSQSNQRASTPRLPLGSWEQLNASFGAEGLSIATHNAACALALTERTDQAERLFRKIMKDNAGPTAYGEALFLLACWKNRQNRQEIVDLLASFKDLTPETLLRFAPELAAVIVET